MKKVLIITYYWPPSGGAGVQRILKFVKYLPMFGVDPVVLTVKPEKATYPVRDETLIKDIDDKLEVHYTSSFEILSFYDKIPGRREVPFAGFANESDSGLIKKIMRFIRGNLFLPDARKGWNKYAIKKASELIQKYNIDTVITSSPPHSTQLIGLDLKKKFNIKWIADLRDPWTDIYYYDRMLPSRWARAYDLKLEKEVLQNADKLLVVSKNIKNLFGSKIRDELDKIQLIPNGYDSEEFSLLKKNKPNEIPVISYIGTMASNYNIDALLEAIKQINKEELKLKFNIIGKVSDNVDDRIRLELGEAYKNLGYVSHEKALQYLGNTDLLLLVIPESKNDKGILTGKLFEYLGVRKPIIGIGPEDGDAAEIINECYAGRMFGRKKTEELMNYLNDCLLKMANEQEILKDSEVYKKYSRKSLTAQLSEIIFEKDSI